MSDPRVLYNAVAALPLALLCAIFGGGGLPASAQTEAESVDAVHLFLPTEIRDVRFGDPVLIPMTWVNRGSAAVTIPTFQRHDPPLHITVRNSTKVIEYSYGQAMNMGLRQVLEPGKLESTVMVACIWAPLFFRDISDATKPQEYTITLRFWSPPPGEPNFEELTHTLTVKTSGSAFTEEGDKVLLKAAKKINSTLPREASYVMPSKADSSPFARGVTPLSWLGDRLDDVDSWHEPSSALVVQSEQLLRPDSRASRMFRASLLRAILREATDPVEGMDVSDALNRYATVIAQADPVEQQLYAFALDSVRDPSAHPSSKRPMEIDRDRVITFFSSRFPHLAPQLNGYAYSFFADTYPQR